MVKTIARVQRDPNDKPLTPVVLKKVTIVPEGKRFRRSGRRAQPSSNTAAVIAFLRQLAFDDARYRADTRRRSSLFAS